MMTLPVFLAAWLAMMAAMMAPSVYPTVRLFAGASRSRADLGVRPAPTWLFVAGYLVVWTAFGLPIYLVISLVPMGMFGPVERGCALLLAGAYQLTKWKSTCLGHCRSPVFFLMHAWRDGPAGTLIMGAHHGTYCVECCWGLMLVLTVLGVMNLVWMVVVAGAIFVEKVLPHGARFGRVLGIVMMAIGAFLLLRGVH
ncbi:MAG: DUF2182 domain-containing protein [Gemmatimonadaceae bacterium]